MDLSNTKKTKKGACKNYKKPRYYIKDYRNRRKPKGQRPN